MSGPAPVPGIVRSIPMPVAVHAALMAGTIMLSAFGVVFAAGGQMQGLRDDLTRAEQHRAEDAARMEALLRNVADCLARVK